MSTRPYLRYSIAATVWTAGLPALTLFVLVILRPPPSPPVSAGIAGVAFVVASAIGAWRWRRFHASARLTFHELMIWAWAKRSWAERSLARGASLLGVDEQGLLTATPRKHLSEQRQLRVLRRLNGALERKDPYTHGHSSRVERYCAQTAAELGIDPDRISTLRRAAALHDVGKMRVPDRILRKTGTLSTNERAVVEEHVVLGARLVARVESAEIVEAVLHHHERWDGRGYPHGLGGTRIPLYARVIAVVDAYDAMTSTRPYRAPVTDARAVEILRQEAGRQFDPEVVEAFIRTTDARVPFAILAPLALGLRRVGRDAAHWMRQPTIAGTAPAAGGMGVATLAAGVLLSIGPAAPDPSGVSPAQAPSVSSPLATISGPRADVGMRADESSEKSTRAGTEGGKGGGTRAVVLRGDDGSGGGDTGDGPAPPTPEPTKPPDDPVDPPDDPVEPPDDPVEPPDDPVDPPEDDTGDGPKGDPQPDKGRDCENPGNPDSRGRDIHCG